MKFISTQDVMVGDTIAFDSSHPEMPLCYMTVESIEEGEDDFLRWEFIDNEWRMVHGDEPAACIILKGTIMTRIGVRPFTNGYPAPIPQILDDGRECQSKNILLINRPEETND